MKKDDTISILAASAAVVAVDIKYIKEEISEIKKKLDDQFVTQAEFRPIKACVYGLVGLILAGVVGALLSLLFTNK